MLEYMPNAGFVAEDNQFTGTVLYSDADQDVSQGVIEVSGPNGQLIIRSEPEPVMGNPGITGTANFALTIDKTQATQQGIYHFTVWVVDLAAHESNHLEGEIRMAS